MARTDVLLAGRLAREKARGRLDRNASARSVRRCEHNAQLEVMEDVGLITWMIGGKPWLRGIPEDGAHPAVVALSS